MTDIPLLATCWITAGNAAPLRGDERSAFSLQDRIEAAGKAGFVGFGLPYPDLVPAIEQYGLTGIKQMLDDNGITYLELEFIANWWSTGVERQQSDVVRHQLLAAAEELGAHHIKVGAAMNEGPWDFDQWTAEFAQLAEQGRRAGTLIALEPMPFGNITTVDEAIRLVEAAGHDSGGIMIDSWHVQRSGVSFEHLRSLPGHRIFGAEIVDGYNDVRAATLWEDCITNRRWPGDGDFDLFAFIASLQAAGFNGAWGLEVVSDEVRALTLTEAVETGYRTARRQFENLQSASRPS